MSKKSKTEIMEDVEDYLEDLEEVPESVDPLEKKILVPSKDIEALIIAVLGANRTAAVDVVNKIRATAEEQNPEVFKK